MSASELVLRADAMSWTPTENGSIVVLDLRTSRYLALNASGSRLWQLLSDGTDVPSLRAHLVEVFGLSDPAAEQDVEAFLTELRSRDLLVS